MHYIRTLKIAKYDPKDQKIKTTITITTDLGETFLDEDVTLEVALHTKQGRLLEQRVHWTSGMRALPVEVDVGGVPRSRWPLRLRICKNPRRSMAFDDLAVLPPIISLVSSEITQTPEIPALQRVKRYFTHLGRSLPGLVVHEDAGDSIARHLWDGSLMLSSFLHLHAPEDLSGPRAPPLLASLFDRSQQVNVLELGCGCGVVGIALALVAASTNVTLTDLPEVEGLVKRNIEAATNVLVDQEENKKLTFVSLDWEADLPDSIANKVGGFDLIIAAECIYNTDTIPALVETMSRLIELNPGALILISRKSRHSSEEVFFDLCESHGLVQRYVTSMPLPGKPGHGYGDSADKVDIYIYSG